MLECDIADKALTGGEVVGHVSEDRSAAALKLAAGLLVPAEVLEAGLSHVRLKLRIATGNTTATPAAMPLKIEHTGINP